MDEVRRIFRSVASRLSNRTGAGRRYFMSWIMVVRVHQNPGRREREPDYWRISG